MTSKRILRYLDQFWFISSLIHPKDPNEYDKWVANLYGCEHLRSPGEGIVCKGICPICNRFSYEVDTRTPEEREEASIAKSKKFNPELYLEGPKTRYTLQVGWVHPFTGKVYTNVSNVRGFNPATRSREETQTSLGKVTDVITKSEGEAIDIAYQLGIIARPTNGAHPQWCIISKELVEELKGD